LGILGIALRSIVRNPRRSLTISIGIVLAITLVVGVFLTADYMGHALLIEALKEVNVDLEITIMHGSISEYKDVVQQLEKFEEIKTVEPYISGSLWGYNITKDGKLIWPIYNETTGVPIYEEIITAYGFRENMSIGEIVTSEGNLNLTGDNVAITSELAESLGLKPGDKVTFSYIEWKEETREIKKVNATVCAIINIEGKLKEIMEQKIYHPWYGIVGGYGYYGYYRYERSYKVNHIITSIEFAYKLGIAKGYEHYYAEPEPFLPKSLIVQSEYKAQEEELINIGYWVFVDRDAVLNPWDIDETLKNLERLEIKIGNVCSYYGDYSIYNNLRDAVYYYRFQVESLKYGFGLSSLPVLFLAWFFALTASWISVNERRREIGLLKVRGATNKQIFTSIIIETVIVGALGGIVGALIGYLSSTYFIKILAEKFAETLIPKKILFELLPFYIGFSIVVGIIISLLAAFIPARRVANMEVQKCLQEYLEEIEAEKWKPRLTWILFILGLFKTVEMALGLSVLKILMQTDFYAGNIFVILLLMVLNFIDMLLLPLGPLFFIYGLSRIITHYASKLQKVFRAIVKPVLGELSDVAVKNFARKSTRTARVMFLMALTLSFGIIMVTTSASSTQFTIKTLEIEVGADIKVLSANPTNETQLLNNISSIEGIKAITTVRETSASGSISYARLIIVDENYFNVSFIKERYLKYQKGGSMEEVYKTFKNGENCCIISQHISEEYAYEPGDIIRVTLTEEGRQIRTDLTVVAVAEILPGLHYSISDLYYNDVIVISSKCAQSYFNVQKITTIQLLIDVADNANSTAIAEKLRTEYDEIYGAVSFEERVHETLHESLAPVFPKFYYIEFIFALIIAITGLSLIMMMAALERQREVGLLVARGVDRKQIVKIFLGEILLIVVISFALGIVEGLSIAYGYLKTFMFPLPGFEIPFKIPLVIPSELYLLLIIGLIASLTASLVPAWYLTKKRIAEVLRIHH